MFEKSRVEIFSDGVLAIVITIMVLELKAPRDAEISELAELFPKLFIYVLSFIYVAIYWNNHHHMFSMVKKVNGRILWANIHLLFWLSLIPFTTSWMGETEFSKVSTILYGLILFMCTVSYFILEIFIIKFQGKNSMLKKAFGNGKKEKISIFLNFIGILIGILSPEISMLLYITVAILWIIPDKRIENSKFLNEK